ncbi:MULTISPECIES: hypothetical protein [unclassified Leifsonia]|uniref:hypothetical protein n=1 Tax=unclassified Leifsonia TaxID=2663824 RepID=UPI0010E65261|nr:MULTISPECIES: hypothetical protein [unclassified Leifsonia]TDP98904.1 hypothetical protein AXZ95_2809 [Leifsonia sp. 115AMFTsu3.1]
MTTAEDSAAIAEAAYRADPLWTDSPYATGKRFSPPARPEREFEVVPPPPVSDPVTGFQAMTVVPVVNGKPDYSQVYISYAGTNPGHRADIGADAQLVIGGQIASGTQATQAIEYAQKVRAQLGKAHPEATFETVGHSLGGYLALFVAAELHLSSTTFNGPDPWDHLSPQAKAWVLKKIAEGKNPLRNFINEWDVVGNSIANGTGSAIYVKSIKGLGFPDYHNISTGFSFDATSGEVIGAGVSGRDFVEISENVLFALPVDLRHPLALAMAGTMSLLRDPYIGGVHGMAVSGVMVLVDTLAATALASEFIHMQAPLNNIKALNLGLAAQMEVGLREAKDAVAMIPFLRESDIENCVATHRLQVQNNIDEHAVDTANQRVDDHLTLLGQLAAGIGSAVENAYAQDAQWARSYFGH